jgi:hypothetical protein
MDRSLDDTRSFGESRFNYFTEDTGKWGPGQQMYNLNYIKTVYPIAKYYSGLPAPFNNYMPFIRQYGTEPRYKAEMVHGQKK